MPRSMEMTGKTFETPPAKYSEYFTNRHDVMNCDDMRIVNCPICGAKHSIGEWFSNDGAVIMPRFAAMGTAASSAA